MIERVIGREFILPAVGLGGEGGDAVAFGRINIVALEHGFEALGQQVAPFLQPGQVPGFLPIQAGADDPVLQLLLPHAEMVKMLVARAARRCVTQFAPHVVGKTQHLDRAELTGGGIPQRFAVAVAVGELVEDVARHPRKQGQLAKHLVGRQVEGVDPSVAALRLAPEQAPLGVAQEKGVEPVTVQGVPRQKLPAVVIARAAQLPIQFDTARLGRGIKGRGSGHDFIDRRKQGAVKITRPDRARFALGITAEHLQGGLAQIFVFFHQLRIVMGDHHRELPNLSRFGGNRQGKAVVQAQLLFNRSGVPQLAGSGGHGQRMRPGGETSERASSKLLFNARNRQSEHQRPAGRPASVVERESHPGRRQEKPA